MRTGMMRRFRKAPAQLLGLGFAIAVVFGFALRLAPLGRYVTPDEPAWVYRSIQFGDALAVGDWGSVPNTGHPGVTTMWLGAAGVFVRRLLLPQGSLAHLDWIRRMAWLAPENGEAFRHLAPFLGWGRAAVALVTVAGLMALVPLLAPVFGREVARLAAILLLLDPFLIGHSGLLHTDALLATFCLLALSAALRGVQRADDPTWWAATGLLSGLAALTKTPGLILVSFIPILLAVGYLRWPGDHSRSSIGHLSVLASRVLLFGICFSGVIFLLYPAMWTRLGVTVETVRSFGRNHIQMAQRPIFFAGRETYEPGLAFYPSVFLFRISPLTLIGLVAAFAVWRRLSPHGRFGFVALLAFATLFAVGLSLGAKKHDRYLLPALPPLTLAAVLGAIEALKQHDGRHASFLTMAVVMVQALLAGVFAAYPLQYANPFAGGPVVAARVLRFEWGEGTGAAARHLNRLSDASELTVAAGNLPSFASMFEGHPMPLDEDVRALTLADYMVVGTADMSFADLPVYASIETFEGAEIAIYTNTVPLEQEAYLSARARSGDLILLDADTPLQRQYGGSGTVLSAASVGDEASMADWLAGHMASYERVWHVASEGASPITARFLRRQLQASAQPEGTVTLPSATITTLVPRTSGSVPRPSPYEALFGGRLALLGASVGDEDAWPGHLEVVVRWQARDRVATDYQAVVALRDAQGHAWVFEESLVRNRVDFPTSAWERQAWSDSTYKVALPPAAPPGDYTVEVSLYDGATGARLGAVRPDGTFGGTQVPVEVARIARPNQPPGVGVLDPDIRIGTSLGPLTLVGADLDVQEVFSGDYLSVALFWQADASPASDYQVRLEWVSSPGGQIDPGTTEPLSLYPTSSWRPGDRFASRHRVHATPDLPAGRYQLRVCLIHPQDGVPLGDPVRLADIEVHPRDRSFDSPSADLPSLDVTLGEHIQLCGYDSARTHVAPGDNLSLSLWWCANSATGGPDGSYILFVHLLGPDGALYGQVDRTPGNGEWPTSSWAPGQVVKDEIAVRVDERAPAGQYQVAVGFYDPAYGDRLPVTSVTGEPSDRTEVVLPLDVTVGGELQ